jgi:hypothetical protein
LDTTEKGNRRVKERVTLQITLLLERFSEAFSLEEESVVKFY